MVGDPELAFRSVPFTQYADWFLEKHIKDVQAAWASAFETYREISILSSHTSYPYTIQKSSHLIAEILLEIAVTVGVRYFRVGMQA